MEPVIVKGGFHSDSRGRLTFNNDFDALIFRRLYFIENIDIDLQRGWQGHQIEKRIFCAVSGSFEINVIKIDNWERPNKSAVPLAFILNNVNMDILIVPEGYITNIKSNEEGSKLLAMSDYLLGEINDEYRYEIDYFKKA